MSEDNDIESYKIPLLNFSLLCCDTGHRSVSLSFGEFTANLERCDKQSLTEEPLSEPVPGSRWTEAEWKLPPFPTWSAWKCLELLRSTWSVSV